MKGIEELTTVSELEKAYDGVTRNMSPEQRRRIESDALEGDEQDSPLMKTAKALWDKLSAAKLASQGAILGASGSLEHHRA